MQEYNGSNIKVLEGLEGVRKRPGMYIGNTGEEGLHHLIWEILDNSIDETSAGFGNTIKVTKGYDNSITIEDFGRGIPVDINEKLGISTVEVVFTVLHAGGKFDQNTYKTSGGLHGVGASVTNALSQWLSVEVCRNGNRYKQEYSYGKPNYPIKVVNKGEPKTGTKVTFYPDIQIFKNGIIFDNEKIKERLNELAFLNKGLEIIFISEEINEEIVSETHTHFKYENGLIDFVENESQNNVLKPLLFSGSEFETEIEVAFTYKKDSYDSVVKSFVNNIRTKEGGSHEQGTLAAIFTAITQSMKDKGFKKYDLIKQEDIKEGLVCVISAKVIDPEFEGQTKGKLNNSNARKASYKTVKDKLTIWLEENPKEFKELSEKILLAQRARDAAKKSRETVRKTELDKGTGVLPSKLADCQSRNPEECELFLTEGESASGSAKQGRDRRTQAILPLKGKVLNVNRVKIADILKNQEINTLITALGTGYDKNFDLSKLRYGKVIIMTDADVDGEHIAFLLILAFFKLFKPLIEAGHLYVAVPPLYRAKKGNKSVYLATEEDLEKLLKKSSGWTVTRFKGLGEMNPDQLAETTMSRDTRRIVQITLPKNEDLNELSTYEILELLGGDDSKFRKWFLMKYTSEASVDI